MCANLLPLFSGFVGAMLGIGSAWSIARWQAREKAFASLRALMLTVGHELYTRENASPYGVLEPRYLEILNAILEAKRFTFTRSGGARVISLGYELLGHNTETRARHVHAFNSTAETLRATEKILEFVGCPYNYRFGPEDG